MDGNNTLLLHFFPILFEFIVFMNHPTDTSRGTALYLSIFVLAGLHSCSLVRVLGCLELNYWWEGGARSIVFLNGLRALRNLATTEGV